MQKNKKTFFIIPIIFLVIIFFGVILAHAVFFVPVDEITSPTSTISTPPIEVTEKTTLSKDSTKKNIAQVYPISYPKQLRIPIISVNAKIQYIGIAKNGKMATPNNFTDVGWFQSGIVPGNKGSAVIDGHVDNGLAFPAVFTSLEKLNIGNDIYIDTIGGNILHFQVTNIKNYDANAETAEIFNQNDGNYIKLITCAGVWSILHRTHDQRLVVTAKQI